jgi:hypothetical protein
MIINYSRIYHDSKNWGNIWGNSGETFGQKYHKKPPFTLFLLSFFILPNRPFYRLFPLFIGGARSPWL